MEWLDYLGPNPDGLELLLLRVRKEANCARFWQGAFFWKKSLTVHISSAIREP
jgi:hypothetical protein